MWLRFVDAYPGLKSVGGDVDTCTVVGGWVDFWERRPLESISGTPASTQPVAMKLHDGEI